MFEHLILTGKVYQEFDASLYLWLGEGRRPISINYCPICGYNHREDYNNYIKEAETSKVKNYLDNLEQYINKATKEQLLQIFKKSPDSKFYKFLEKSILGFDEKEAEGE
jgi:hypothetical protein